MNKELCSVLKNKLSALPFVDMLAGMAQTLTQEDTTNSGEEGGTTTITKRFPVADDTNQDATIFGKEIRLSPESGRRSIIYFEDFGISAGDKLHGLTQYNSSIRLIAWLNRERLTGNTYAPVSGAIMATIINALVSKNPENINIFTRLVVSVARIPPQDPALFGRYTYNEAERQYLRPPFEFFGIDFTAKYFVSPNCLTTLNFLE